VYRSVWCPPRRRCRLYSELSPSPHLLAGAFVVRVLLCGMFLLLCCETAFAVRCWFFIGCPLTVCDWLLPWQLSCQHQIWRPLLQTSKFSSDWVGRLVGRWARRLVGRWVGWPAGCLVGQLAGWLVGSMVHRLVGWWYVCCSVCPPRPCPSLVAGCPGCPLWG